MIDETKISNIKAVFFDNDSTLFNHSGIGEHILPSSIEAIKKLNNKGYKTCMITSRSKEEMYNVPKSFLDLFDDVLFLSGGYITSKNNIEYTTINYDTVQKAISMFDKYDLTYRYATTDGGGFLNKHNAEKEAFFKKLYDIVPDIKKYEGEEVLHFIVYADPELANKMLNELKNVEYSFTGVSIEYSPLGVDKGYSLEKMCKKYNISLDEACVFGDSGNDVSMLKKAGFGICLGNGTQSAKEVADYVTDNIWEDGVMNALKHFKMID